MSTITSDKPESTLNRVLKLLIQIVFWGVCCLLLVAASNTFGQRSLPGAPAVLLYATLGLAAVLAIVHFPPVFARSPKLLKALAYLGLVAAVSMQIAGSIGVREAFERTPEAKRQASEVAKLNAGSEAREAQVAKQQAEVAAVFAQRDQEALNSGPLAHCAAGDDKEIGALSVAVRESLPNPASYEHVVTRGHGQAVSDDPYNVLMTFRAENRFGAIRRWSVLAKVDPSTCEVGLISDATED